MKPRLLSLLATILLPALSACYAQAPFPTTDSININRLTASVLVHGDMWWDPATYQARCDFPTGSGKSCNFAGSIWLSGYDNAGGLHVAAQTYRQDGNDYWPGPLDASDTLTYATAHDWAKIWKINLSEIDAFRAMPTHTIAGTPASILTWPGRGNTYAQGNAGAPLTITTDMAPFEDLNGNGIYEPLLGEYPAIRGQQALWWVFSDNGPTHNNTNGRPLKVEVHAMSYGYSRGTLIDNVVYYDYQVINRGTEIYHNMRFAQWNNTGISYPYDDYIGFDSTWRMAIAYNAINCDGCAAGNPANTYGYSVPHVGITMIQQPADVPGSIAPMGSFTHYNNDNSFIGTPTTDTQFNYYMRARMRDGSHFKNDFTVLGLPAYGYGPGPDCNYVYDTDPSGTAQWSECAAGNLPSARYLILSSNDFSLASGSAAHLLMAMVVADSAGGCGNTNFSKIREVADTAWCNYHHEVSVAGVQPVSGLRIYPNPAHDVLTIEKEGYCGTDAVITVYNVLGQIVSVPCHRSGSHTTAYIDQLPTGIYMVQYADNSVRTRVNFIKE